MLTVHSARPRCHVARVDGSIHVRGLGNTILGSAFVCGGVRYGEYTWLGRHCWRQGKS